MAYLDSHQSFFPAHFKITNGRRSFFSPELVRGRFQCGNIYLCALKIVVLKKTLHNRVNRNELKKNALESKIPRTTLSFYTYAHIDQPEAFRDRFYQDLTQLGVFGRIYVAREGVNAQISVLERRHPSQ